MAAFLQYQFVTMLDTIKRPLFQFMGCDSLRVLIYFHVSVKTVNS